MATAEATKAGTTATEEVKMVRYEALFLVEPTAAAKEWDKTLQECHRILTRHGAKILGAFKWGERKLAYPVRRHKRGAYLITYLDGPSGFAEKVARDVAISEVILRLLLTRYDGEPKTTAPALEPELRIGDRGGFGGRGGGFGGGRPRRDDR